MATETPERELRMWQRIRPSSDAAQPTVLVSTLTPFPFWLVIASMVIFLPLVLIVAFWVKRQAVIVEGDALLVLQISFWRYRVEEEVIGARLGEKQIELDEKVLLIDGDRFHIEPGWIESAEQLVELNAAARAA